MDSTGGDLICGVCKKLIGDPYSLPCGHTFCLRPCLLSHASAMTVSCIHCRATFDVAELCPNYTIMVQLNQLARQRQQQQNWRQNQKEDQKRDHPQEYVKEHQLGMTMSTGALENVSLLDVTEQEEKDHQSGCEDEDLEDDSVVRDASTRKQIFVGGIPARTNCKQLRDHFSRYGTVKNCFVSPHKPFGSVTFESEESARKAISKPIQFVCGKRVEVKEYAAKKKHGASKPQSTEDSTNESKTKSPSLPSHSPSTASNAVPTSPAEERQRVFIGGISHKTTVDSLRAVLSTLGPIKACGISPNRGFAMVVFERPETAELAISARWHIIDDKLVEMKAFMPNKMTKIYTDKLETRHDIGAQHCLHSLQQEQVQKLKQNEKQKEQQGRKEKGRVKEKTSMCAKRTEEISPLSKTCSTCQTPVEARLLNFCHHCHRDICPKCRENHRDNYILMLHAKLDDLPRQLAALKLKSPTLKMEKKAKDEMIDALDKAVLQLYLAANTALDTAMAKVETMVEAGEEIIGPLVGRMRGLLVEVGKIEDVYARLDEITNLREAMVKQNSLENLSDEVARLGEMVTRLPPLPITQMHLSDLLTTIDLHLNDFSLVTSDGSVSLPRLPFSLDIAEKRREESIGGGFRFHQFK
ncbi:RNA-binding protein 1 [Echinococcus granulosus]|nr:RNA-binding protein 1 [Echinococcus granulosus]